MNAVGVWLCHSFQLVDQSGDNDAIFCSAIPQVRHVGLERRDLLRDLIC